MKDKTVELDIAIATGVSPLPGKPVNAGDTLSFVNDAGIIFRGRVLGRNAAGQSIVDWEKPLDGMPQTGEVLVFADADNQPFSGAAVGYGADNLILIAWDK